VDKLMMVKVPILNKV